MEDKDMTRRAVLAAAGVTGLGGLAAEATAAQAQVAAQEKAGAGSPSSSAGQAYAREKAREVAQGDLKPLPGARTTAAPGDVSGTGFTFKIDWGNRHGQWILPVTSSSISGRSRVFVEIGEGLPGGPDAGKFIGGARYTVHNVAPHNGGVDIWVDIEWGSDIRIYVDYLVINP
jgi:hypothetical protein